MATPLILNGFDLARRSVLVKRFGAKEKLIAS
jgi:hypothetical protein